MADLKALRNKVGLTQKQLAEKVGVSDTTIQNWENGKNLPQSENMNDYLVALGVTSPEEQKKIIGEMGVATYTDTSDPVDNIPYFLFEAGSAELTKIKNCYASAEELDMLGYQRYVRGSGRYANIEKRKGISYPMEYAFFEKHGGFNATMNKINEAWGRLAGLHDDALDYAEENPGIDYRLSAIEKHQIIDKIGLLLGDKEYGRKMYELALALKLLDKPDSLSVNGVFARGDIINEVVTIVQNSYRQPIEARNYGRFDGFIEVEGLPTERKNIVEHIRLTERGKQLVEWFNPQ